MDLNGRQLLGYQKVFQLVVVQLDEVPDIVVVLAHLLLVVVYYKAFGELHCLLEVLLSNALLFLGHIDTALAPYHKRLRRALGVQLV